jgi:hypothetical protein
LFKDILEHGVTKKEGHGVLACQTGLGETLGQLMENNAGNCFTSYLQGMYIVFVMFQTAIVKGRKLYFYRYRLPENVNR